MADFNLTVRVDPQWVSQFNQHGMKLCLSAGVESDGSTNYNVVAFTSTVAQNINISWKDAFKVAASKDSFHNGVRFTVATTVQDISFNQTYTLPNDWTDRSPNSDPRAPRAGFGFHNNTDASIIVYKTFQGSVNPIYFSPNGPLPPGNYSVTPKASCRLWFANGQEVGSMVSDNSDKFLQVDLTGSSSATVSYDATGTWSNL